MKYLFFIKLLSCCLVDREMCFWVFLLFLVCSCPKILAQDLVNATIIVNGTYTIAETDDNFVCVTLDWWPPEKCNYYQCPWGNSSALNLVKVQTSFRISAIVKFGSLLWKMRPLTPGNTIWIICFLWFNQDLHHPILAKAIRGKLSLTCEFGS